MTCRISSASPIRRYGCLRWRFPLLNLVTIGPEIGRNPSCARRLSTPIPRAYSTPKTSLAVRLVTSATKVVRVDWTDFAECKV